MDSNQPTYPAMPVITLSNGLRVGNFGSPHSFRFTTGEELPAATRERVEATSLRIEETEYPSVFGTDVIIEKHLTPMVEMLLDEAQDNEEVDVVLVPLMLMELIRDGVHRWSKFRVVRVADRHTKAIFPDKFCL